MKMNNPKDLYVITTAKVRDSKQWNKECERFNIFIGANINQNNILLKIDSWNNIKKYENIEGAFFIFDEQRVVGHGAWVKSFLKITKKNNWILLSATPGDTWMDYIPVFIANGFYKNRAEFLRRHVIYDRFSKWPKVDRYLETRRLERLKKEILVDMPYEKKTKKIRIDVLCDFDKNLEKEIINKRKDPFNNYEPIKNSSKFCFLLRKVSNSNWDRINKIKDILKVHKKIIVFYNFNFELDMLRSLKSVTCVRELNAQKHEDIPETDTWAYLVQYGSGAEGWNCTKTNTIVFYSLNYSYRIMEQASGRIDRLDTPYNILYYYYLKSKSRMDSSIVNILKNKKKFNEKDFTDSILNSQKNHGL